MWYHLLNDLDFSQISYTEDAKLSIFNQIGCVESDSEHENGVGVHYWGDTALFFI